MKWCRVKDKMVRKGCQIAELNGSEWPLPHDPFSCPKNDVKDV